MEKVILHPSAWALAILAFASLWLGVELAFVHRSRAKALWRMHFAESRRERLIMASLGFYVTLAFVRTLTHLIRAGVGPFHDVSMRGRHIHHLVWGIFLLLGVGYAWLLEIGTGAPGHSRRMSRIVSAAYGAGAALTLDEFALWLNLRDVYWEREGHASIDALMLFAALLSIGVLGRRFFHALAREALGIASAVFRFPSRSRDKH